MKLVARRVKIGQLAKSNRQLCLPTKWRENVAQLCCVSDIGLGFTRRVRSGEAGLIFTSPRPERGATYYDEYVCLSVCLSARITPKSHGRTSQNYMHVVYGRGLVLL